MEKCLNFFLERFHFCYFILFFWVFILLYVVEAHMGNMSEPYIIPFKSIFNFNLSYFIDKFKILDIDFSMILYSTGIVYMSTWICKFLYHFFAMLSQKSLSRKYTTLRERLSDGENLARFDSKRFSVDYAQKIIVVFNFLAIFICSFLLVEFFFYLKYQAVVFDPSLTTLAFIIGIVLYLLTVLVLVSHFIPSLVVSDSSNSTYSDCYQKIRDILR